MAEGRRGNLVPALADAAMRTELGPDALPFVNSFKEPRFASHHGILIHYKDGLKGVVLKLGDDGIRWEFRLPGRGEKSPRATRFHVGPWQNRNLFKGLSHAIQIFFREKKSPYPVERTLLTTGILSASMDSTSKRVGRSIPLGWISPIDQLTSSVVGRRARPGS